LVAIDRIPFPRPDEPVMAARAAQVDSTGGSGFMQVSLSPVQRCCWHKELVD
jgi:ATP-dependent DNA helicase DinG